MDTFAECRCLICYREGDIRTFSPKPERADYDLECPECLNNDSEYIEILHVHRMDAVYSEAG